MQRSRIVPAGSGQHLRHHPPKKTIAPLAPASTRATPGFRLNPAANLADGTGQGGCRSTLDTVPAPKDARRAAALPGLGRPAAPARALSGHHCVRPCRVIDSTGIKARGEGEWHARKHGGARRRVWRKVHLAVDAATLEVRAVEITRSGVGDAPMLPGLLSQIPADVPVASVTAPSRDHASHDPAGQWMAPTTRVAAATPSPARGAEAIIPPRRNAKPWKKDSPGAAGRNEALRAIKRLGRTIWRRWSGYHRRGRVETKPLGTLRECQELCVSGRRSGSVVTALSRSPG